MSMICNRCEMLTEPMGHSCEFCGECGGVQKERTTRQKVVLTHLNTNKKGRI